MFVRDEEQLAVHPCFSTSACSMGNGRLHLPVARRCNILCNYCLRGFDCPNESRPGVTSRIISPEEAVSRVQIVVEEIPSVKVIGIAGPGDPLCNSESFEAMGLIRELYPDIAFCISTNGLLLSETLEELRKLNVNFLTVTVNAVDADVAGEIYAWVLWKGKRFEGLAGASLLIDKQRQGLQEAARMGFFIKVNSVMIPGVNTHDIPNVARMAKHVDAQFHNIMPLIPLDGTRFADIRPPSGKERRRLQSLCGESVPQMTHCRQCRADAVGCLGEDRGLSLFSASDAACHLDSANHDPPLLKVAVASKHEGLVDLHFGHAREFAIYQVTEDGTCTFVERRPVAPYCAGPEECGEETDTLTGIERLLRDCRSLFCARIGVQPANRLKEAGIEVVTTYARIDEAVRKWFVKVGAGDRENDTK